MTEPWTHYSVDTIEAFQETAQKNDLIRMGMGKPLGLYFARGEQWKKWCKNNSWHLGKKKYFLNNVDNLKLLVINASNVAEFHKTHALGARYNWVKVAEEYDGVIIEYNEIMNGLSMSEDYYMFISSMDCDTLCIWKNVEIDTQMRVEKNEDDV